MRKMLRKAAAWWWSIAQVPSAAYIKAGWVAAVGVGVYAYLDSSTWVAAAFTALVALNLAWGYGMSRRQKTARNNTPSPA